MKYQFESEEELLNFIRENVMFSNEVTEYLECTKQALSQSVRNKKLSPIKQKGRAGSLFFKKHVEERKEELEGLRKKYRPYEED